MFDVEFPLLAFSHCRDVVAAVTNAGGLGVFGAVNLPPDRLQEELAWIDREVSGRPYGVDLIVPNALHGKGEVPAFDKMMAQVPSDHIEYAQAILTKYDIDDTGIEEGRSLTMTFANNLQAAGAQQLLDVAFSHPISLIVNALGFPPSFMVERARKAGVPVGALVGTKQHALGQVEAGVDFLIVSGGEAGGHCGDVSTMVLVPEVYAAIQPVRAVPILAAGGIVTGSQMAAAMAMGADGAWCGSVWLTTNEAETNPAVKEKMLAASSRDTVRSKFRTGKPSRQLRSPWTAAWESNEAPAPLPMPLMGLVAEPPLRKVDKLAEGGHEGAKELATYWVGQGVGLMNQARSVRQVVQDFREDFLRAYERLQTALEG